MFNDSTIVAQVATADLPRARAFYGGTLGMSAMVDAEWGAVYSVKDHSSLIVYARPGHVAPQNTCATFLVDDPEATARALQAAGVALIDYDLPQMKTVDGIWNQPDGGKAAWFRDPDGNIFQLQNRPRAG